MIRHGWPKDLARQIPLQTDGLAVSPSDAGLEEDAMAICADCKKVAVFPPETTCSGCKAKMSVGRLRKVDGPVVRQPMPIANPAGQHLLKQAVVVNQPGPALLAPGTLPAGAALQLSCRRQGEHVWQPVAGTIYVLKDTAVEFQVTSQGGSPALASQVRLDTAQWSGLAQGRGKTCTATCRTLTAAVAVPDTVSVAFGGQAASANVVVFDVTPTATLVDTFAGRSATELGVCEEVDLGFTTMPAGLAAAVVGGLRWRFKGGAQANMRTTGLLLNNHGVANPAADGTARFRAPYATHPAGTMVPAHSQVTLELAMLAGPSAGKGPTLKYTVHKPQIHMTLQAGNVHHWNPGGGGNEEPSAGFVGVFHFTPKNVSFRMIGFREGRGNMQSDGVCAGSEVGIGHQPTSEVLDVSAGDSATGCTVTGQDNVHSGSGGWVPTPEKVKFGSPTTRVGGKRWPITWEYTYRDIATGAWSANFVEMQKAYHELTIYENERAVMEKGHKGCTECTARTEAAFGKGVAHFWP